MEDWILAYNFSGLVQEISSSAAVLLVLSLDHQGTHQSGVTHSPIWSKAQLVYQMILYFIWKGLILY